MARVDYRNRRAGVTKLPDGRLRVSRVADVLSEVRGDPGLDSEVWLPWGTPDEEHPKCRLIGQEVAPLNDTTRQGSRALSRVFEELPETDEVQVGKLRIVTGEDGREFIQAQFIQFSAGAYDSGTIGEDEPPGYTGGDAVLSRVEATDDGTLRRITRLYAKASATPFLLGEAVASIADPRAFVDTSAGEIVSATRFAREWTVRYLVAGDASVGDGHWHAVNSPMAFGTRTGYLTATRILRQGLAYSVIARVYNELPHQLNYQVRDQYTFPAKLGLSNAEPYISQPSTTREVSLDVEETYEVGEASPHGLEWEVLWWAQGAINYTPQGAAISGTKGYDFNGAIGFVSIVAVNRYFNGYKCSSINGIVESNPASYPTGKKRISSKVAPWRGDIWRRRNIYVTFP